MRGWLRALFFGAGISFMAVASWKAVATGGDALPPWPVLALAAILTMVSLLAAARGWAALLDREAPARLLRTGFIGGQVGKYIPGGVWVGAGQIGLAVEAGASPGAALGALGALGISFVAAAGVWAGILGLVLLGQLPTPPTPVGSSVLGLCAPLLLYRRWLAGVSRMLPRKLRRRMGWTPVVPPQMALVRCFAWLLLSLAFAALTFLLVLGSVSTADPVVTTAWAFVVAWLAGFLAVGLPSGLGAREGMLAALLVTGTGPVLAACLIHRLIQIAVEAALLLATRRIGRERSGHEPVAISNDPHLYSPAPRR